MGNLSTDEGLGLDVATGSPGRGSLMYDDVQEVVTALLEHKANLDVGSLAW